MGSLLTDLLLSGMALLAASYFAFLETAFTSMRLYKVKELEEEVGRFQQFFATWKGAPQKILSAILITNNFFNILCSVMITRIMENNLGEWGIALGVAIATVIVMLFADIVPKTAAKLHQGPLFRASLGIIDFLLRIMGPLVNVLLASSGQILRMFGIKIPKHEEGDISEAEIEFLIGYGDEKGLIEAEKSEMLQNVFSLGQTAVSKIMVPKNDMVVCDIALGVDNAKDLLVRYRYSRLPLYEDKEDNVIGMVYHKDLFSPGMEKTPKTLKELMRPVMFIPESKKINQLLREFLKKRMHMGIVVDEHGAVAGLVTLEDVLEEIVGEIRDEHEREVPGAISLKSGGWLINAGMPIEDVEELLGVEFEVENSVTLAGFMMEVLQRLPKVGDSFDYKGFRFIVHEASKKRVFQVRVNKIR